MPDVSGGSREEQPHIQRAAAIPGAGGPRGATPRSRSGGAALKIPLIQGKEQWLPFAGAAVKRHPMSKVRENQVRR